jgi:RNA-directed DNA polymerase
MNPPREPLVLPLQVESLRDLEFRLGIDRKELRALAENWKDHYSPFQQEKKTRPHQRTTKAAKVRYIDNPSRELKLVQKRILVRLLHPIKLPHFIFGAVSERCIRKHAQEHIGAKLVVKMDVKDYYPSINCRHVYGVFRRILLCAPPIAKLLTQLTTYNWHLPQGSPTSPALANIFLASIYSPVLSACEDCQITPTAWVDDLIFSGDKARSVMELVRRTLAEHGLKLSAKKRVVLNGRDPKEIAGVRMGATKLRAKKKTLHDIRAGIHNWKNGRVTERGREKDLSSLQGQIAHVRSICPSDAVPLEKRLKLALTGALHPRL